MRELDQAHMASESHLASESFAAVIARARTDRSSLGELLRGFQPLLLLTARRHINSRLEPRCAPSDAVQQALAVAVARFDQFRGTTPEELKAWLTKIQENILREVVRRHVVAGRRSIRREIPLLTGSGSSASGWAPLATDSTPSRQYARHERRTRLTRLIDDLPTRQQEAMRLHYLEERKVRDIADQMQTSDAAVAGLIKRALHTLRQRMNEMSWR